MGISNRFGTAKGYGLKVKPRDTQQLLKWQVAMLDVEKKKTLRALGSRLAVKGMLVVVVVRVETAQVLGALEYNEPARHHLMEITVTRVVVAPILGDVGLARTVFSLCFG